MSQAVADQLFLAYMGRAADTQWRNNTATLTTNMRDQPTKALKDAFYAAGVSEGVYAASDSPSSLVNKFFLTTFGFAARTDEQTFWGNLLANGTYSAGELVWQMFSSYANNTTVLPTTYVVPMQSKLVALAAYSDSLAANPTQNAAYSQLNSTATAAGRTYLNAVTSQATAATAITGVAATVAGLSLANGQTFTLTTGVEEVVGTAGADTFVGLFGADNGTGDDTTTISTGDTIDGGAGSDTLNITVSDAQSDANVLTLSSVETVSIRDLSGAVLDAATWDGVEVLRFDRSTADTEIYDIQNGVSITLNNVDGATDVYVYYDTDALGTATYDQVINLVGDNDVILEYETGGDDEVTELTIAVGAGSSRIDLYGEDLVETLTVSGSGDFEITENNSAFNALATVAAGTMTGGLTIDLSASAEAVTLVSGAGDDTITSSGNDDDLTTGAGNDAITVAAAGDVTVDAGAGDDTVTITAGGLDDADTIDGGAGTNRIVVGADDLDALETAIATDENVTGFAEVEVSDGAAAAVTFDADAANITAIELSVDVSEELTIDSFAGGTLTISVDQNDLIDVTADELTLNLTGDVTSVYEFTATDVTDLVINVDADAAVTVDAFIIESVENLTITGDQDLDLETATTAEALVSVDASDFTGDLQLNLDDSEGVEITLGDFGTATTVVLDSDETATDTIVFVGALENDIEITNFTAGNAVVADILDLSSLEVTRSADLTFTNNNANLEITSDLFDGTITLVGVQVADMNNTNFVFA